MSLVFVVFSSICGIYQIKLEQMQNKEFFLKYQENQPTGVKTHILNTITFEWFQTVFSVGDLVAAYKTAVAPLLNDSSLAVLTLHSSSVNGIETSYNSWDPLSVLGENGRLGTSPLIIKSKKDLIQESAERLSIDNEMDVDIPSTEEAISSLIDLITSLDDAQDSMKAINLDNSVLSLKIFSVDGIPNLLYSEEIYEAEMEIGIKLPIEKLVAVNCKTISTYFQFRSLEQY